MQIEKIACLVSPITHTLGHMSQTHHGPHYKKMLAGCIHFYNVHKLI